MFHKMAQMIQAHTERMLLDEVLQHIGMCRMLPPKWRRCFRALDAESRP